MFVMYYEDLLYNFICSATSAVKPLCNEEFSLHIYRKATKRAVDVHSPTWQGTSKAQRQMTLCAHKKDRYKQATQARDQISWEDWICGVARPKSSPALENKDTTRGLW